MHRPLASCVFGGLLGDLREVFWSVDAIVLKGAAPLELKPFVACHPRVKPPLGNKSVAQKPIPPSFTGL